MRQSIFKKFYDSNWQYSRADATIILDSLDKYRPNIRIIDDQINERRLNSKDLFNKLSCLQFRVFDEISNCKKILEVFSADIFKQNIDYIIFYSKKSQFLIKRDWLLQVFDSYYLDQDKIFYAIEYEYFDFTKDEINIGKKNELFFNINNYVLRAYEYSKHAFQNNSINFPLKKQEELLDLDYVFQYQQEGKIKIKFNTINPFLFEHQFETQMGQQQPQKKIIMKLDDKLEMLSFDFTINKEKLSELITKNIVQEEEKGKFEEIIIKILNHFRLDKFIILSIQQDVDSVTLRLYGYSQDKHILFDIKKLNQNEQFQEMLKEKDNFLQQLNLHNVKLISKFEVFSIGEGLFFVEYFDLNQQNEYTALINCKDMFTQKRQQLNIGMFYFSQKLHSFSYALESFQMEYLSLIQRLIKLYPIFFKLKILAQDVFLTKDLEIAILVSKNIQKQCESNFLQSFIIQFKELTVNLEFLQAQINNQQKAVNLSVKIINHFFSSFQNGEKQMNENLLNQLISYYQNLYCLKQIKQREVYQIKINYKNIQNYIFEVIDPQNTANVNIFSSFNLKEMIAVFQQNCKFGYINVSNLFQIILNYLKTQLNGYVLQTTYEQLYKIVSKFENLTIFSLNDKRKNEYMLSNLIDQILDEFKDFSNKIKQDARKLVIEYIHRFYELDSLKANPFKQNLTSKVYCLCQSNQFDNYLSQNNLLALTIECLMHIILQEQIGFNQNFYCLCSEYNKLISLIADSQKQLQHLKFDIYLCEQVRYKLSSTLDYFNLKNKKNLCCLEISGFQDLNLKDQYLIYYQLKYSDNKINTLIIRKNPNTKYNPKINNYYKLLKLKGLVNIQLF